MKNSTKSMNQKFPCNPFPKCEEKINNKKTKHTLTDPIGGESTLFIENPQNHFFHIIKVDKCFEQRQNEIINDFLILDCQTKNAYVVELKGGDFIKAMKQVESGTNRVKKDLLALGFRIHGRVVLTNGRAVRVANQNSKIKINRFFEKLGGNFEQKAQSKMILKL